MQKYHASKESAIAGSQDGEQSWKEENYNKMGWAHEMLFSVFSADVIWWFLKSSFYFFSAHSFTLQRKEEKKVVKKAKNNLNFSESDFGSLFLPSLWQSLSRLRIRRNIKLFPSFRSMILQEGLGTVGIMRHFDDIINAMTMAFNPLAFASYLL